MNKMTVQEEGKFLTLFNRDGVVLDFKINGFDTFTKSSIGVALHTKYKLSMGKSLNAYFEEARYEERLKLICDLFHHYEKNMEYEYNKEYKEITCWGEINSQYVEKFAKIYNECKSIIDKLECNNSVTKNSVENLKASFSSEYMTQQLDLMISIQSSNPTEAIGKAKELIESCCRTILDNLGSEWSTLDTIPALADATMKELKLLPKNVQETDPGANAIKAILGNLRAIPSKLAEIRNAFGSGHGRSASFQGLEERHAKLAIDSSFTFVNFIWSTYENQRRIDDKQNGFW